MSWRNGAGVDRPQRAPLYKRGVLPQVSPAERGTSGASASAAEHLDGNRSVGSIWSHAPNGEVPEALSTGRAAVGPNQLLE